MDLYLQERVIVVTGAAVGQGRAHAEKLVAAGAAVVLCDIDASRGQTAADELTQKGHRALFVQMDVSERREWETMIAAALDRFGKIDGLVNNAGIGSSGDILESDDETWKKVLGVNQTGVFLGMNTVAPHIIHAGGGSIVNTSSTLGFHASPTSFVYQATKGAVRTMTKSAALSLGSRGVRVNAVFPGLVDTPFIDHHREGNALENSIQRTPLKRIAQPAEISSAVAFLLSSEASYINGAELVVDGGMTAGSLGSLKSNTANHSI